MDDIKKVSVVMCTYNGKKYIRQQLDSILTQSYPIYEIIIQDDCSTDDTWNILMEYQKSHPIIQCYRNEQNVGVNLNFKNALLLANGEFIAISDQDDIWYDYKIKTLINLIGDNLLAFSRSKVLYSNGSYGEFPFEFPSTIEQCILKMIITGHSCLFNRSILDFVEKSIDIDISYDFAMCQAAYLKGVYIYTNDNLQIWRRHTDAVTKSLMNSSRNYELTQVTGKGKFNRLIYSIRNLVLENKSNGIEKYFSEIAEFQIRINGRKHIIKLCFLLANQSIYNYFKAAWICLRYRRKFFPNIATNTLRQKLSFISYSLRYPFTLWNELHSFEAL